jgi:hypothetical protein
MKWRPKSVEALWQKQATAAAIASARKMIGTGGALVPADTPVASLTDEQLGMLLCACIFSWIACRAQQAADDGNGAIEANVHSTGAIPEPWDAGAVETILGDLADTPGIAWDARVFDWPRDMMVRFVCAALDLATTAMRARDHGGGVLSPSAPLVDAVPF